MIELTLSVAGDSVSAELVLVSTRIPVSGRAVGRTIDLAGSRDDTPSGNSLYRMTP